MQLTTFAMLCGAVLFVLCGCPVQGRLAVTLKMRGSCDGKCKAFKCGTPNRGGRVVGGKETASNEYPWLVSFTYRGKLYCSGSLVDDRHIITAAHCIRNINKNLVVLTLGSYIKNAKNETGRQVRKIGSAWFHPSFQSRTFNNDIAVVKMNNPVSFTKEVRPICLPDESVVETYEGKMGIVAGWGRTAEQGAASDRVRAVKVPIMTNAECKTKKYESKDITDNMMCAGYDDGKIDACQGDSGGPLMYKNGTQIEIIGVVSWGEGCARPLYPGVYTRLSKYRDLIETQLSEERGCSCPPP